MNLPKILIPALVLLTLTAAYDQHDDIDYIMHYY